MSLHCSFYLFALLVCTFFIHSAFSFKSFFSLHIVSQNLSISFIAGVLFTGTFSFPISLSLSFFESFLKNEVLVVKFFTFHISSHSLTCILCFTVSIAVVIFSSLNLYFLFNSLHIFPFTLIHLSSPLRIDSSSCRCLISFSIFYFHDGFFLIFIFLFFLGENNSYIPERKTANTTLHPFHITSFPVQVHKNLFVFWFTVRLFSNSNFFFHFLNNFLDTIFNSLKFSIC